MTLTVIVASGIFLPMLMLFGRPAYRFIRSEKKDFRVFLLIMILIRIAWAVFAYGSIWYESSHPEQWHLDAPGSALIGYTAIFPVFILTFDWLLMMLLGASGRLFNSKFDIEEKAHKSI